MRSKERISYWANPALGLAPYLLYAFLVGFISWKLALPLAFAASVGLLFLLPAFFERKIFPFFVFVAAAGFAILYGLSFLFSKGMFWDQLYPEVFVFAVVTLVSMGWYRFSRWMFRLQRRYLPFSIKSNLYELFFILPLIKLFLAFYILVTLCYYFFFKESHTPESHRFFLGYFRFILILALILIAHIRLVLLNRRFESEDWLPIIDEEGSVIGKIARSVSYQFREKYLHPHIRIMVFYKGKVFLKQRDIIYITNQKVLDVAFAKDLCYGQDFPAAVNELMGKAGHPPAYEKPRFFTRYLFERKTSRRMIFLYTVIIKDDKFFSNKYFSKGKLWTEKEIENNIGKGVFADIFEQEFELLQATVFPAMKMMN